MGEQVAAGIPSKIKQNAFVYKISSAKMFIYAGIYQ